MSNATTQNSTATPGESPDAQATTNAAALSVNSASVDTAANAASAMSLIDFGSAGRVKLMHNHAPVQKL